MIAAFTEIYSSFETQYPFRALEISKIDQINPGIRIPDPSSHQSESRD